MIGYQRLSSLKRGAQQRLVSYYDRYPSLRNIISNAGWLTAERFIRMGVGIVVGSWVARHFGPEEFGALNYAIAFSGLFLALTSLGLDNIVKRELVRSPENIGRIVGTALCLRVIVGVLVYLVMAGMVLYSDHDALTRSLTLVIGLSLITGSMVTFGHWLEVQLLSKYFVWIQNGVVVVCSVARIVLILTKQPIIFFAWTLASEQVLGGIMLIIVHGRLATNMRNLSFAWSLAKGFLKQSWPLLFTSLVVMFYMRIDQVMLGKMLGTEAVGVYSAALRISEIWYFVPVALASSLFPTIIRTKAYDENLYKRRIQHYFNLSAALGYGSAILALALAPAVIRLLYGQQYVGADRILAIHIWSSVFVFLGAAREQYFLAEDLTKFGFQTAIIGAVCNVLINLILIPRYGGIGAAMATVISQALAVYGSTFVNPKTFAAGVYMSHALVLPFRVVVGFFRKGRA